MTKTAISTVARRIQRALNARPAHFRLAFDGDGNVIGHEYGPVGGHLAGTHIFPSRPDSSGGRWTQRTVQEALDAPDPLEMTDSEFFAYSAEMDRA